VPDATQRFGSRADNYARYRPGYPPAVIDVLRLTPGVRVADLGSGTGIFARLLVEAGGEVWAVEPNGPMREAAERDLESVPGFHSVNGRAEATTLADESVDLVTAAQAAHWFDIPRARVECRRILRPGGRVAFIWNVRLQDANPFLRQLEDLLRTLGREFPDESLQPKVQDPFFGAGRYQVDHLPSEQVLDWPAFQGRIASASYTPEPGASGYEALQTDLRSLFDRHQQGGVVRILYDTRVVVSTHGFRDRDVLD
jgi:SAM-dependent methyltransferase